MPSDRDAGISDAAFREALDAAIREAFHLGQSSSTDATALSTLATRVLALYAEREKDHLAALEQVALATARMEQGRAERQGEVYEVEPVVGEHYSRPGVLFQWYEHRPGDRVRVVRCEVGMYDPKNDPPTGGAK